MNEPLVTVSELAARLSTSKRTVYGLVAEGRVPYHRLGPPPRGGLRFRWSEVLRHLDDLEREALGQEEALT